MGKYHAQKNRGVLSHASPIVPVPIQVQSPCQDKNPEKKDPYHVF